MITKPADNPQVCIVQNTARSGLVHIAIGTGTDGYNITADRADELAAELSETAAAARAART
jgi:hypothetical protein